MNAFHVAVLALALGADPATAHIGIERLRLAAEPGQRFARGQPH